MSTKKWDSEKEKEDEEGKTLKETKILIPYTLYILMIGLPLQINFY
jgi:hypothetical protein